MAGKCVEPYREQGVNGLVEQSPHDRPNDKPPVSRCENGKKLLSFRRHPALVQQ
jgi:hypothetical protein